MKKKKVLAVLVSAGMLVSMAGGLTGCGGTNGKDGDIIEFGDYTWIVLDKTEDTMLIITEDIVEERAYNEELGKITWENCTLRTYLNEEFYEGFSEEEQEMIVETTLINSDNSEYGTDGGNDTTDKIFLLSLDEVEEYMTEDELLINDTSWWLRSPGCYQRYTSTVNIKGNINTYGEIPSHVHGVRPALNLKIE